MIRSSSILSLTLLIVVSCDGRPPPATEKHVQPGIMTNGIMTNGIMTNALTANAIAMSALASNALAGDFPTDESLGIVTQRDLAIGLQDPDAQMLIKYLVSCALLPGQRLRWTSRFSSTTKTWRGDMGLCPRWLASAPSPGCLERVSACLLARNNAFGIAVPISLRGLRSGSEAIPLSSQVPLWPKAWRTNSDVQSAKPCQAAEIGVTRNCGWQSVGVGRCAPGEPVSVGAGGCGLGSSTGHPMLRVCTRMHFCDDGSPERIAQNDGACGTPRPRVDFSCPAEGFYAVMAADFESASGPADVSVLADPPLVPSSEAQVFTWREGAFYGNIFEPGALNPLKPQVRVNPLTGQVEEQLIPGTNIWVPGKTSSSLFAGIVYQKMWACSAGNWTLPDAYFERRICGGLGGVNCAAKYAGPCGLVCRSDDGPPDEGDRDYAECVDLNLHSWGFPITPFLNHPCDLLSLDPSGTTLNDVLCRTVSAVPSPPPPS